MNSKIGRPINNLRGQMFGRLLAAKVARTQGNGAYWLCYCECGEEVEVRSWYLTAGKIKSCGCYRSDSHADRLGKEVQ